ncbi:MAG: hypothetical protein GY836_18085 [Herbaspirillum sp.]|nr:hypothetical protein [Herbaspirillum sp.]
MAYSIIYLSDPKKPVCLNDLVCWKIFKFVKVYERYMLKHNLTPVVSFKSNKGLLDYKKFMSSLKFAFEIKQKNFKEDLADFKKMKTRTNKKTNKQH